MTVFGVSEDLDRLKLYRDRGIARVVVSLPSANADEILPMLDRWAELIRASRCRFVPKFLLCDPERQSRSLAPGHTDNPS